MIEIIPHLEKIFKPMVSKKIDPNHEIFLILESEFGSYNITSTQDLFSAIELATSKNQLDDGWLPVYAVNIADGRSWPIEFVARIGEEISLSTLA